MPAKPAVTRKRYALKRIGSRGAPRRRWWGTRYMATTGNRSSPAQYIQCGRMKFSVGIGKRGPARHGRPAGHQTLSVNPLVMRSEERRVGKEGRSRWGPD